MSLSKTYVLLPLIRSLKPLLPQLRTVRRMVAVMLLTGRCVVQKLLESFVNLRIQRFVFCPCLRILGRSCAIAFFSVSTIFAAGFWICGFLRARTGSVVALVRQRLVLLRLSAGPLSTLLLFP